MKNKFIYKNKKTGQKVYSDKPLNDKDLVLVKQVRDGRMKGNEVTQK
ncbi:MAG: hypothetical protein WC763_04720 [Candidatus Paceibacterota bacterium]|jgi:hypothetical protein